MFGPPEDWMPNPFHPEVDWRWMRCPMCQKRPFIEEGSFTTAEENWLRVKDDGTIDTPILEKTAFAVPQENTDAYAGAWDKFIEGGSTKVYEGEAPEDPNENADESKQIAEAPKKTHTLLDEVMRLHALGMKPGQISRELEKAGHSMSHLQIGKKIKEELRKREAAA
jgi:hypothetical protein